MQCCGCILCPPPKQIRKVDIIIIHFFSTLIQQNDETVIAHQVSISSQTRYVQSGKKTSFNPRTVYMYPQEMGFPFLRMQTSFTNAACIHLDVLESLSTSWALVCMSFSWWLCNL